MTFDIVKDKLHEYIEHANQTKIMALYTLMSDEIEHQKPTYDEQTLIMLETRKLNMLNGTKKPITLKETINNIMKYRKNHGI